MSRTFTCAMCHGTFDAEWTEEEAKAELKENFGDIPISECAQVCDDCYVVVKPSANPEYFAQWQAEQNTGATMNESSHLEIIGDVEYEPDRTMPRLPHIKRSGKRHAPKVSRLRLAKRDGDKRTFSDGTTYRVGPRGNWIRQN